MYRSIKRISNIGIWQFIVWLRPLHTIKGKLFLMYPTYSNGMFYMVSLNKWKK